MISITSWNRCAFRFLRAPVFEWRPPQRVVRYRIEARARSKERVWRGSTRAPRFDFTPFWKQLPPTEIQWVVKAFDRRGRERDATSLLRFWKAESKFTPATRRADWLGAVERNMRWLMTVRGPKLPLPKGETVPKWAVDRNYGPTLPVWVWHADVMEGKFLKCANFPPLQWQVMIRFFLEYAKHGRDAGYRRKAWDYAILLGKRMRRLSWPRSWACGGMPATMISQGRLGHPQAKDREFGMQYTIGSGARGAITWLWLADATGDRAFERWASGLAGKLLQFQRKDGGLPSRVHCKTGHVLCEFGTGTILVAQLFDALARRDGAHRRRWLGARDRAVRWMIENPARTNRWEAMYEDMEILPAYENLSSLDALTFVRYLCEHAGEDPGFIRVAERVYDWVEDQFVVFGRDDSLKTNPPLPSTFEQYHCPYPMEAHTANWLETLLALHKATGQKRYWQKAFAAANAIVGFQAADGRFYTFGKDRYLGQPPLRSEWFACNALADVVLMQFAREAAPP